MVNRRRDVFILCCFAVLSFMLFTAEARADVIGFEFGMDDIALMGIQNTSDSASIEWITITFYNDTFFDTSDDLPGSSSITSGFQLMSTSPGIMVTFPDNDLTDGASTATITFSGFDALDSFVHFAVDLDVLPGTGDETLGDPLPASGFGTLIVVGFDTNDILTALLVNEPGSIPDGEGTLLYTYSASASKEIPVVPVPASMFLLGTGLGFLGLTRRRFCKK